MSTTVMSRFVHGDGATSDRELVEQVLCGLTANLEKWEAVLAAQESVTFTADWGDIYAVCNSDGRLMELALARDVMSSYTGGELTDRLNSVFEALRKEVQADFDQNYDGGIVE
jgi:Protein of unknown function (DUF2710)